MKTERLRIENFAPQDWQALKAIVNDFTRSEYARYDMPFSTEDEDIKELAKIYSQIELFYAVWLGDVMIGYVCFHELGECYDIGYIFRSDYHGKGYAYEACAYLMEHLAKTRNVKAFTAGTALKNTPSCRMLGKLGFALIGTEKMSFQKDENGKDIAFEGGNFKKEI